MAKFGDTEVGAILRGARAFGTYPWPGKPSVRVAMRVLTDGEVDDARLQAQVTLRDWSKGRALDPVSVVDIDPEHFTRQQMREVVFLATHDPDTTESLKPERFFLTPHDVRHLSTTEVQGLFDLYVQHQASVTPLREAGEEEVGELLEAMGKGPVVPALLADFERSTLLRLLLSMVSKLHAT